MYVFVCKKLSENLIKKYYTLNFTYVRVLYIYVFLYSSFQIL